MARRSNTQRNGPDGRPGWFSVRRESLRTNLGFPSAIVGMAFLAISSFSEKQLVGNQSLQSVVFVVFTGLFVAFIFLERRINSCLEVVRNRPFSLKAVIHCLSFVIVSGLVFLIKYPRFNIHSALTNSTCIHGEERKEISHENQFNLFSVGAFSLLAFLISSERQRPIELGFSSLLIGLIIDTSMDIPGRDGLNLWYMLGAALYCIFLIFMKHYIDSLESTRRNTILSNTMSERLRGIFRELLKLVSAAFGIVCLFFCPFSKNQFGNDTAVLGVSFFIIFALLLGYFMSKAPGIISYMENQCHDKRLVKAMVSSLLLMIFSVVIFLTKYPRFQIHSKHKESCADQKIEKKLPHGSQFDLYSAVAFSLVALTISSRTEQSVELGIFNFLLALTMDASIETLENKAPNIWCMLAAAVYCVALIFARIYLAPADGDGGDGRRLEGLERLEDVNVVRRPEDRNAKSSLEDKSQSLEDKPKEGTSRQRRKTKTAKNPGPVTVEEGSRRGEKGAWNEKRARKKEQEERDSFSRNRGDKKEREREREEREKGAQFSDNKGKGKA